LEMLKHRKDKTEFCFENSVAAATFDANELVQDDKSHHQMQHHEGFHGARIEDQAHGD